MSEVSPISTPVAAPAQPAQNAQSQSPSLPRAAQSPQSAQPAHPAQPPPAAQPPHSQPSQPPHQNAAVAALFPNATPSPASPHTFRQKLSAQDRKWPAKIGLRVVLVLTSIIGIGCAGWATSKYGPGKQPYRYELDDSWSVPWSLITFVITAVWSFICIAFFALRSAHRPVHPGAQVGVDLILWLAYIVTALLATLAAMSVANWGNDGSIDNYWYSSSDDGRYQYVASNNSWVYNATSEYSSPYYSSSSSTRDCDGSTRAYVYGSSGLVFGDCTEEDLFVNQLWHAKSQRFNVELTAAVLQWLNLLLHFILFVWACVDTHRRNSRKVGSDAEKLAADIVMRMVQSGAIITPPGQAHARAPQTHIPFAQQPMTQMMPQQFPQQYGQPTFQHQQQMPPVAPQQVPASYTEYFAPQARPTAKSAPQPPPKPSAQPAVSSMPPHAAPSNNEQS